MKKLLTWMFILLLLLGGSSGCATHRLPKPGPDFVWVPKHPGPEGRVIPGHWRYTGPPQKGRTWVQGHYGPGGTWIPGHWK